MGIPVSGGRASSKAARSGRAAVQASGALSPRARMGRATVAAAVAGILYSSAMAAYAADDTPAAAAPTIPGQSTDSLQEVVVTANANQGVKKLDASYNI